MKKNASVAFSDDSNSSVSSNISNPSNSNNHVNTLFSSFRKIIDDIANQELKYNSVNEDSMKEFYSSYRKCITLCKQLNEKKMNGGLNNKLNEIIKYLLQEIKITDERFSFMIHAIHDKIQNTFTTCESQTFTNFQFIPILQQLLFFRHGLRRSYWLLMDRRESIEIQEALFYKLLKIQGELMGECKSVYNFDVNKLFSKFEYEDICDAFWKIAGISTVVDFFHKEVTELILKCFDIICHYLITHIYGEKGRRLRWMNIQDVHVKPLNTENILVMSYFMEREFYMNNMQIEYLIKTEPIKNHDYENVPDELDVDEDKIGIYKRKSYHEHIRNDPLFLEYNLTADYLNKITNSFWEEICKRARRDCNYQAVIIQEFHNKIFQAFTPAGFYTAHRHLNLEVDSPITISERSTVTQVKKLCEYFTSMPVERILMGLRDQKLLSPFFDEDFILESLIPPFPEPFTNKNIFFKKACFLAFIAYLNKIIYGFDMDVLYVFKQMLYFENGFEKMIKDPTQGLIIFDGNMFYFVDSNMNLVTITDQDPCRMAHILMVEWCKLDDKLGEIVRKEFMPILRLS